ncbi:MAG: FtsX-like permease family protein [Proteobacteria bacterium]|nr:FtsX-like permease family protein [Pseudomonadota bacterium]
MVALYLAAKNVTRKKERSLLTIVGVLLAVGAFISLLSLAEGLYDRVQSEMHGRSVDVYVLPRNSMPMPAGPIGGVGVSTESIPLALVGELAKMQNVESAAPVMRFQQVREGRGIVVWALDKEAFSTFLPRVHVDTNRFPSGDDEVIVGQMLARELGLTEGATLRIADKDFKIVGFFSAGGGLNDYFCYVTPATAARITGQGAQEVWIKLKEDAEGGKQLAIEQINTDKRFANHVARTREQYLGAANDFIDYAWLLQFAVAAIGVLIAMTAAMNTMLMSTYERLKEFATLRAIGASRLTVALMLVAESVMLSLAGGFFGVIIGVLGAHLLDSAMVTLLKLTFPLGEITLRLVLQAMLMSVFVGLVGAVVPCALTWRMNIIYGLRQE